MTPIPTWQKNHEARTKGRTMYNPDARTRRREAEYRAGRGSEARRRLAVLEWIAVAGIGVVVWTLAILGGCWR